MAAQTNGNAAFATTTGVATTDGDVLLDVDGALQINEAINGGTADVRLVADGAIDQGVNGGITANELGARQQSAAGDITLDNSGNNVDVFAASNAAAGGTVVLRESDGVVVGAVPAQSIGNASFANTAGIATNNGDVLLDVDGAIQLDEAVSAGTADVRLVADGDVSQGASGQITANELGVRQEAAAGNITLDNNNNDVDVFAANNAAAAGTVALRDNDGVTVGAVAGQTSGNANFTATAGVSTNNGDILLDVDGAIQLDEAINAGTADVRLVGDGNIAQGANGQITANELGVRQESAVGDILLDNNSNDVDVFAARNAAASGNVVLRDSDEVTVGRVLGQAIGNAAFGNTAGISTNDGDVLLDVDGALQIDEAVSAGTADVRLVADGAIAQGINGQITANELGARQESAAGNITLDNANNDVDVFAANNAAAGGTVALRDSDGVVVGSVAAQTNGNASFANTAGITTNNADVLLDIDEGIVINQAINVGTADVRMTAGGSVLQGAAGQIIADELGVRQENTLVGDVILDNNGNDVNTFAALNNAGGRVVLRDSDEVVVGEVTAQSIGNASFSTTTGVNTLNGDVLLDVDGSLQINEAIDAVTGDVRLVADGAVSQGVDGSITANELGVRQVSAAGDITLDNNNNDVDVFAALNSAPGGVVALRDADGVTIGSVAAQTVGNASFSVTNGVTTNNGDVLLDVDGGLQIDQAVNVGASNVRIVADGDVGQGASGAITATQLGVRQENAVSGDVVLSNSGNDVDVLAVENAAANGVVVMRDADELTLGVVAAQTLGNASFANTTGLSTTNGDVLLDVGGSLQIDQALNAGTGDARIVADGDVTQSASGIITANELGIRQQSAFAGDVLLQEANQVDAVAILNQFELGLISFTDSDTLVLDQVSAQNIDGVVFANTTGVISDDGTTGAANDGSGNISISVTAGSLADGNNIPVITGGDGVFQAGAGMELVDQIGDSLLIGGNANFVSTDIEIGQDSAEAGESDADPLTILPLINVSLGTLTLDAGVGTADITEDNGTNLVGINNAGTAVLTTAASIGNDALATVNFTNAQFNAENGTVFIGKSATDTVTIGQLGVVATNASFDVDGDIVLNGTAAPDQTQVNLSHAVDADEFQLSTSVSNSLFVHADAGSIVQNAGSLDAVRLGLMTVDGHVRLNNVAATNVLFAAMTTGSDPLRLADRSFGSLGTTFESNLNTLANVGANSDVLLDQQLAVAINHQGTLNIGDFNDPFTPPIVSEITTMATDEGGVLLVALNRININHDITATATTLDPQITGHVRSGVVGDASRIQIASGVVVSVDGNQNDGSVIDSQVVANFIDPITNLPFAGTTDVLVFDDIAGSANQFIELQYGNIGSGDVRESGYRIGFVWDSQRRFDGTAAPEPTNLYVFNPLDDADEAMTVLIVDQGDASSTQNIDVPEGNNDFIFNSPIETNTPLTLAGQIAFVDKFGFQSTFQKVINPADDPNFISYDLADFIERRDSPFVITTVEVRNDQDINFFVGANPDNSLNAVQETIQTNLETNQFFVPPPSTIVVQNEIFAAPPAPVQVVQAPFQPPQEPVEFEIRVDAGQLSWVPVEVDADDLIAIGDELILKNPDEDFTPAKEAAVVRLEGVEKNEIQEIINQIEEDPKAETGVWYKIFIDYDDRSGKKDELLFYYFKTGQKSDQPDLGPESDLGGQDDGGQPVPEAAEPVGNELTQNLPESGKLVSVSMPRTESVRVDVETAEHQTAATYGVGAGAMLLANLAAGHGVRKDEEESDESGGPKVGFSRFERLKRKIAGLVGRNI